MRPLLAWVALATLLAAMPAAAQSVPATVVTSTKPDHVSVTLYSSPYRSSSSRAMDADNPDGYALVTETRTVTLPAGVAVIRFEGVAGNILPESALITGLPDGVEEKNLDASLLSPRSLFDRALGRRVLVRRTDPATGKTMLLQATLKSGVDGAAVLEFASGDYGDLRCSGMPEMLVYDGVPAGLSARPTLSVRTISAKARTVTLTLSYLAGGFDWQANYIVAMKPDGRGADLFAWITLASSDVTSFPDADLQVVAGKPNRDEESDSDEDFGPDSSDLSLKCWPMPVYDLAAPPPPPPSPVPLSVTTVGADIIVTGSRRREALMNAVPIAVTAISEQLGDLKLYRFPRRVTVASNSQKQVGMLSKPSIKLTPVYRSWLDGYGDATTEMLLRGKNVTANGLGIPLPGGRAAIFDTVAGRSLLIGESAIDDKTVGEEFELVLGEPGGVNAEIDTIKDKDRVVRYQLTVTNSNPWPIDYEGRFRLGDGKKVRNVTGGKLGTKDGMPIWTVRIPANGTATLSYTIVAPKDED